MEECAILFFFLRKPSVEQKGDVDRLPLREIVETKNCAVNWKGRGFKTVRVGCHSSIIFRRIRCRSSYACSIYTTQLFSIESIYKTRIDTHLNSVESKLRARFCNKKVEVWPWMWLDANKNVSSVIPPPPIPTCGNDDFDFYVTPRHAEFFTHKAGASRHLMVNGTNHRYVILYCFFQPPVCHTLLFLDCALNHTMRLQKQINENFYLLSGRRQNAPEFRGVLLEKLILRICTHYVVNVRVHKGKWFVFPKFSKLFIATNDVMRIQ